MVILGPGNMPLPQALLNKLAKRGLVEVNKKSTVRDEEDKEEIIAEDYDDNVDINQFYEYEERRKKPQESAWSISLKRRIVEGSSVGYKGCPNKWNIFHKCTQYCCNTWGDGNETPSKEYLARKRRLLRRYPLPKGWKAIFDAGCGVHYYWDTVDETVSWLPPSHPKSCVSKAAAVLRRELEEPIPEVEDTGVAPGASALSFLDLVGETSNNKDRSDSSDSEPEPVVEPQPRPPVVTKKPRARNLDKTLRRNRMNKTSKADLKLDPMDPAAYSDIPRGKWSAGLNNDTKKTVEPEEDEGPAEIVDASDINEDAVRF